MEQLGAPAPAPSEVIQPPVEPISAADQAVIDDDQAAFKDAKQAERAGKPLPPIDPPKAPEPPKPDASPVPAPDRELSKRQLEANERTRLAVERAHADLVAENARLRALVPRESPQPAQAPTPQAEHKRYLALPDAPKLDQFDSVEEYSAAMGLFIAKKFSDERDASAKQDAERTKTQTEITTRDTGFRTRLAEHTKTNPAFLDTIDPEIIALRPYDALIDGERPSAANELAEHILRSDDGPRLMVHLTKNPDAKQRLIEAPSRSAFYLELGKVQAAFDQPVPAPTTKTISSAPEPPTTLGTKTAAPSDPSEAAIASGDFTSLRQARLRARMAHQR